jgi:crotonobetainyl-CoA:carnitine CoA-transferase CaiB-like acyl-CoA transferase
MRQWGMDYQSLRAVKPDIICISMSGLGHTGPRASYVSYGPTLQALSGYTQLMANRDPEDKSAEAAKPAGYGYSYADMAGGYSGALAALIALWHRRRTRQGQFIDLSQFEAIAAVIGPSLLDITVNGRQQPVTDYRAQEAPSAPHGVYRCLARGDDNDRWIAIAVRSHVEWRRFVVAIGSPEWASDPKFATLYMRMRNRVELDRHIETWTRDHGSEQAMMLLQSAGIAAGVVSNGEDLCARDPHLQERGFWTTVKLPDGATTQVTGVPFRLSNSPAAIGRCAPEIGENNDYVFGNLLGLSPAQIESLAASGAIWL